MTDRVAEKVIVVTGAGSGMGLATTHRLAQEGARIVAADIREDRLSAAFSAMPSVHCVKVDMADPASVSAMIDAAVTHFGTLDVLVNNAGVVDGFQGIATMELDIWRSVMNVNLEGPMHAMRRAVPIMLDKGAGSIINIVSTAGIRAGAAGAAYTASKHALLGLSRNTAWVYAQRGIRCNAVLPGGTLTAIGESMRGTPDPFTRERLSQYQALIPQFLEPVDIANVVLFLASDESRYINGAEIAADAGWATV